MLPSHEFKTQEGGAVDRKKMVLIYCLFVFVFLFDVFFRNILSRFVEALILGHYNVSLPFLVFFHAFFFSAGGKKNIRAVPIGVYFSIGLVYDIFLGSVIGFHAALFVVAYGFRMLQAQYTKSCQFPVLWGGYALFYLVVECWRGGMTLLLFDGGVNFLESISTIAVNIVFFPFAYWMIFTLKLGHETP